LDGHSRSAKHRSSAKDIGIFDDDSHKMIVSHVIVPGAWVQIMRAAARSAHSMNSEWVKT
jgi:hypothetical protein